MSDEMGLTPPEIVKRRLKIESDKRIGELEERVDWLENELQAIGQHFIKAK